MGKKTIDVTIVGKGAYGALIAGKYARNDDVTLKAFVSRHAEGTKDKLTGAPIVRTAASWRKKFGRPRSRDVFDLCVHEPALLEALRAFTAIGARSFLSPNPLRWIGGDWSHLSGLLKQSGSTSWSLRNGTIPASSQNFEVR